MFLRNCKGYYVKVEIYFYTKFNGVHLFSKTHLFCSFFSSNFFKNIFCRYFLNVWGQPPLVIFVTRFFGTIFQKDFWRGLFFCIYFFCRQTCWTNTFMDLFFCIQALSLLDKRNKSFLFKHFFRIYIYFYFYCKAAFAGMALAMVLYYSNPIPC